MRVLHVLGQLIPGGVETRTLELIRATAGRGVEHHVCLVSGKSGVLDHLYLEAGARLFLSSIDSPLFPIRFGAYLRKEGIDVVHATIASASGIPLAVARLVGVKNRIAHLRSDGDESGASRARLTKLRVLRGMMNWGATQIVGLTPANLSLAWSDNWEEDPRTSVVPNGVSLTGAVQPAIDFEEYRGSLIIVHVGRGELPTKRRDKAIAVMAALVRIRPDSQLFFVGRDALNDQDSEVNRARWEGQARNLGIAERVHFMGERHDVSRLMRGASALLMTSTLEGLPGVVLEALASGLPVVASDVPGAVFISQEVDGVEIVPAGADDRVWAEALAKVPAVSSEEVREERIESMRGGTFDIASVLEGYLDLWRRGVIATGAAVT